MNKQSRRERQCFCICKRQGRSVCKGETGPVNEALERSGQVHAATECFQWVRLRESLTWGRLHQIALFFSFLLGEGCFLVARERLQLSSNQSGHISSDNSFLKSYQRSKTRLR